MSAKASNLGRLRAVIQALGDKAVVVPHVLIDYAGGLEAGAVVAGLLFWSDKGKRADGFFWKTYGEWWEERRVSEHIVRRVTRGLAKQGLIEIKLVRANGAPTLHYRVTDALVESLAAFIEEAARSCESSESDSEKVQNPNLEKFRNGSSKSPESLTAVNAVVNAARPSARANEGTDERPTAPAPTVKEPSAAPASTSARVNKARAARARAEEEWGATLAAMQQDCERDEERFGVWSLATGKRAKALAKAHGKTPAELLALWRAIAAHAHKPVAYLNSIANAGTWQAPDAPRRPMKKRAFWIDGERVLREVPA